jgi:hypothetical protein|tara:strand:- start:169 stop:591 length:423 start_codon:yes stop_codon:yes gene_type:complete
MTTKTSKVEKNLDRPKRIPMAEARQILNVDDVPDHLVARWVLDTKNRCQVFENAGYQYITDRGLAVGDRKVDGSKAAGSVVCKVGNSTGEMLYLMAIDRTFYEEDQASKQARIDEIEEELYAQTSKEGHYGNLDLNHKSS